jgi:hypothetical protein
MTPVAIVGGMVAGDPRQGGATWAVLQYVFGLQRLGYEVVVIEPVTAQARPAASAYLRAIAGTCDGVRVVLIDGASDDPYGEVDEEVAGLAARAHVLINISGMVPLEPPLDQVPVRIYLDLDPGFNQVWHSHPGVDVGFEGHTHHATVGTAIGSQGCPIPTCGIEWIPTLPPVVLDRWPVRRTTSTDALTTVGNWRSYGSVERDGELWGQRAHSVRSLLPLSRRSTRPIRPALSIDPGEGPDLEALADAGWELLDPAEVAATPDDYRRFVSGSWAEIGIAKSGYVASRSGWFSDRSACYLAAGRPVVAQATGFEDRLPTGEGLHHYHDVDEAVDAVALVASRYEEERRAARAIAEDHLDSDIVLRSLLRRAEVAA